MSDRKVGLVTGAGSGIGRAVAIGLGEAGWNLVLAGRRIEKLEETAGLLGEGVEVQLCAGDVRSAEDCGRMMGVVREKFGRLDGLVNVAGVAEVKSIPETTPEVFSRAIETNLGSVVELTRLSWGLFEGGEGGVVVNVSSMASLDPFDGFGAYGVSKVGVNLFTLVTAREGEAIGVRAVCVAPGAVETGMLRGLFGEDVVPVEMAMGPGEVGEVIVGCVTGMREFENGGVIELVK